MAKNKEISEEQFATQVQEWKEKYGEVYELPVDDKTAYLKEPDMADWKRIFSAMQEDGEIGFAREVLSACWLGGDTEIKSDDDYFLSAKKRLIKLFEYPDPILEKQEDGTYKIIVEEKVCICRKINRNDIMLSERKNPSGKPFVTQENLFAMICKEKDDAFNDRNSAKFRFPLYKAMDEMQNQKIASLKKL